MSFGQYLLGTACLLSWVGLLLFSAGRLAGRLAAFPSGATAFLPTLLISVALGLGTAVVPGLFGLFTPVGILLAAGLLALATGFLIAPSDGPTAEPDEALDRPGRLLTVVGVLTGGMAVAAFLVRTLDRIETGMTGFDSTWYHGPIAAEFIETGEVLSLHTIAPQFLTWFYPHNSELIHASAGMLFGGDLPSLVIGLLWFGGSLLAGWAIGSGRSAAPLSMAGVALAIGSFAFADQAGEARNDLAGTFFLLGGVGVAAAAIPRSGAGGVRIRGAVFLVALAAGLAAGTKLNFLLPGLILALGAPLLVRGEERKTVLLPALAGFLAGGSFWYFRNLLQSGNPLPWIADVGPLSLPGPDQERGGRDPGSVLDYLGDPTAVVELFPPDLIEGLGAAWPLLLVLAVAGLALSFRRPLDRPLALGAVTGIAVVIAWLVGPTSASGPDGDPVGFLSGLRYLVPGLAIGLALLGPNLVRLSAGAARAAAALFLIMAPFTLLAGLSASISTFVLMIAFTVLFAAGIAAIGLLGSSSSGRVRVAIAIAMLAFLVPLGYLVQDRYQDNRYAAPEFVTAGLAEAFAWAQGIEGDSIGTTATRSYPFYGMRFDNRVGFIGVEQPNGGFVRPEECREFVDAVNRGRFEWVVASLDREGVKRDFPPEVRWLDRDPAAVPLFRNPPTAVFAIEGRLDPGLCPDV